MKESLLEDPQHQLIERPRHSMNGNRTTGSVPPLHNGPDGSEADGKAVEEQATTHCERGSISSPV